MPEVMEEVQNPVCAIAEYDPIAAALATLSEKYGKVVFDVNTKVGLESAKSARAELRGYRTNLEATRKNIKNPALERCRLIDAEAKDITAKLEALEKPIAAQIEAEESRKEAEKQAKLQAEIERVTALRSRISAFTALVDTIEPTSDACQEAIVRMKAIPIDDTFEELQPDAQQAKDAALFRLQNLFAQYTASEAEAERIKDERLELEKLREADRLRREEDDRKAAAERQRLAAEQEAQLAEDRRKATQLAEAERLQREAVARKIRQEQQAEQHRLDAQAAELRRQQEEVAKVERERLATLNVAEERVRAAAPLLLTAIEDAMQWFSALKDWTGVGDPNVKMYSKAIAIAKGKNYFAEDGTLMNADGTRSIFDDVDQ